MFGLISRTIISILIVGAYMYNRGYYNKLLISNTLQRLQ